jgi:hypothetical protein
MFMQMHLEMAGRQIKPMACFVHDIRVAHMGELAQHEMA